MKRLRFYFLIGLAALVGVHWLVNLPHYLLYGISTRKSAAALSEVDLRDTPQIKNFITQGYGSTLFAWIGYADRHHNGIDIAAKEGAPVYSPAPGKILALGNQDRFCNRKNYGKFVVLRNSGDGYALLFAHLSKVKVGNGDEIDEGEVLGHAGQTGRTTGSHLHFAVFKEGTFAMNDKKGCGLNPEGDDVDPVKYLRSL